MCTSIPTGSRNIITKIYLVINHSSISIAAFPFKTLNWCLTKQLLVKYIFNLPFLRRICIIVTSYNNYTNGAPRERTLGVLSHVPFKVYCKCLYRT